MAKSDRKFVHKMSNICGEFNEEHYNSFCYKVTPEVLRIPSEGSLEVTLTPLEKFGDGEKLVIIHSMSYLFEILDPTGKETTQSQIYGFFTRNDVIKFRIALRKEQVQGPINDYELPYSTANGFLTVKHGGISSRAHAEQMLTCVEFKIGTSGMIGNRVDWAKSAGCWDANLEFVEKNQHISQLEKQFREARPVMVTSKPAGDPISWKSQRLTSSYLSDIFIEPSELSTKRSPQRSENRSEKSIASKSSKTDKSGKSMRSEMGSKSEKSGVSTKSGKSARSEVQSNTEMGDENSEFGEVNDKKDKKKKGKSRCEIM